MLFRIAKRLPPHILRVRTLCEGQPIIPEQFKDRSLQTKRKASPFDALGYQLGDEPSVEGPHATQRGVIDGLGETSFTISGVRVTGPVLVMPYFSTLWNVEQMQDITPQSFALIKLMVPRPDIVLIGTGAQILPIPTDIKAFFKEQGVNVDALDTKNACHTYNVLNQEARNVAAALLPLGYQHDFTAS